FSYRDVADGIMTQQKWLLASLLKNSRLKQLMDAEVLSHDKSYKTFELVHDLQAGLWSELEAPHPRIDPLRRALQQTYLEFLKKQLEPKDAGMPPAFGLPLAPLISGPALLRPVARAALVELTERMKASLPRVQDQETKLHLQDALVEIEHALHPCSFP